MVKINVGVYLGVAIGLAWLAESRRNGARSVLRPLATLAALSFPVLLMRSRLGEGGATPLLVVVSLASVSLLLEAFDGEPVAELEARGASILATAVLATVFATSLPFVARGLSLNDLWYGLVGQHARLADSFFFLVHVPRGAVVIALLATGAAVLHRVRRRASERLFLWLELGFGLGVLATAGAAHLAEAVSPAVLAFGPRGGSDLLLAFATPFLWLLAIGGRSRLKDARSTLPRLVLAFVAVFQVLLAYPLSGSQLTYGTMPIIIAAVVALHDASVSLFRAGEAPRRGGGTVELLVVVLLVVFVVAIGIRDETARRRYRELEPLRLPGAETLRLPPERALIYRSLVRELRSRFGTFVSLPALNSLYFWSELEPPTSWNATFWPRMLTDRQQREVIEAIGRRDDVGFVFDRRPQPVKYLDDPGPLVLYLFRSTRPVGTIGPFEIRERSGR
jgi:hypothetical protein